MAVPITPRICISANRSFNYATSFIIPTYPYCMLFPSLPYPKPTLFPFIWKGEASPFAGAQKDGLPLPPLRSATTPGHTQGHRTRTHYPKAAVELKINPAVRRPCMQGFRPLHDEQGFRPLHDDQRSAGLSSVPALRPG